MRNKLQTVRPILLAAGLSRRFFAAKLEAQIGNQLLFEMVVDNFPKTLRKTLAVVVHPAFRRTHEICRKYDIAFVVNEHAEAGMYSSLRLGLKTFAMDDDWVMICLADQPYLRADDYQRLVDAACGTVRSIVAPMFRGQRGNPVIFAKKYFDEILAGQDKDHGAAFLLSKFPDDIEFIEMNSDAILRDIDTPEDFKFLASATAPGEKS